MATSTKVNMIVNGKEMYADASFILIEGVALKDILHGQLAIKKELRKLQAELEAERKAYKEFMEALDDNRV